jgi:hypothetical protein
LTNNIYLSLFPGSVLSGISVYFILSYLFVPITFAVPGAIIVSFLVFGLAWKYTFDDRPLYREQNIFRKAGHEKNINSNTDLPLSVSHLIFVIVYLITLIITGFFANTNQDLFVPWNKFTTTQIILLTSSISLCFFFPGYVIVDVLDNRKHEIQPILKVLLAYTFSIAIIGFGGYISASLGYHTSEVKPVLLGIYAALLIYFIVTKSAKGLRIRYINYFQRVKILLYSNSPEILVFASLFALVILSTYSLYQGVIIGDQWFHHGRTLSFLGGGDRSEVDDTFYSSFSHGILASFISLSGVPSVNAYSSISFLNIIPVFAFYYFFNKWVPSRNANWPKAALLACTFFMLSSGFGWINMITMSATTNPVKSPISSAELFHAVETRTLDIQRAGAFIITSSPQFGTSLTLFALPLGFVLLGLVKEKINPKIKYVIIVGTTTTVGILSHDEFYLFIIVGCFLPLIFKLSERKNSIYLTFLCSMLLVAILDITFNIKFSTVRYYTAQEVFGIGIPLIVLIALIVGLVWILYVSRIINWLYANASIRQKSTRKFPGARNQVKSLGLMIMVAVISYLYIFTFLVWGQLSSSDIHLQQDPYDLPWYLYPMKLGITGLLGIAFILSYLFRKFEKEIFVFGIIAIIALFLGPYYDEYRLSKYIMVAMGAFASIFITRIIFSIHSSHTKLIVGLVIGLVVITSSLSTLISTGYVASALQNPDFEQYSILLRNKIFPTPLEFNFLSYLHKNLNFKKDHIVLPLEYGDPDSKLVSFRDQKLANKIQAFVGTPLTSPLKILKNPFTFNTSTIEGLYSLLNIDNVQYLILPKENIVDEKIQLPIQFALENFRRVYEDGNYIVLTVPSIVPPISSLNGIALIYKPEGMLLSSLISDEKVIQFDNRSFDAVNDFGIVNLQNKDHETLTIFNGDKRGTLWSNLLQQKQFYYIETKFRTLGQNDSVSGSSGIVWHSQDKEYHASINHNGLQLSEREPNSDKEVILSVDQNVRTEINTWYTLKVLTVGNTISVYLDDILKLKVHTDPSKNTDIARVGIRVDHETSEFEPIKIGHVPLSTGMSQQEEIYYQLYYPLNELSLSKSAYDTFVYGDKSAFSHKTVMLPWDPAVNDTNFDDYLQFVNNGGKLIVINAGDNFTGGFSRLLNLKAGNLTEFDGIALAGDSQPSHGFGVSGSARTIDLKSLNATVRSYYINEDMKVAPFAIERKYGSTGGEIIFVNCAGYFGAVHKFPQQFFLSLGRIPSMLDVEVANYTKQNIPNNVSIGARFVGELKISGDTTVSTSSLLIPNASNIISVADISISNGIVLFNGADEKNKVKNILISNLSLSGAYRAIVESTGLVFVPSLFSPYDYIGISFPERVNLTLKMLDGSAKAQFVATVSNDTGKYNVPFNIGNKEEVRFHSIGLQTSSVSNQTLIMKEPLINATGYITVNNLYIPKEGERDVILKGLNTLVDHSDIYLTKYQNASRIQYVTYLKWIEADGMLQDKQILLKLPGDISERAKRKGVQVPWEEAMVSKDGIILLLSVTSVTAVVLLRLRPIVK